MREEGMEPERILAILIVAVAVVFGASVAGAMGFWSSVTPKK